MKSNRGAQQRNRNALKHGFYSRFLSPEEARLLRKARSVDGLDSEIALLRLKISHLISSQPVNLPLILRASNVLGRLLRVSSQLDPRQVKGLDQAVADLMREVASPLGLDSSPGGSQENLPPLPSEVADSPLPFMSSPLTGEGKGDKGLFQHSPQEKEKP